MHNYFAMFAAYNRWANERLYATVAELDPADFVADRGAFFKSVHGTLNHILVADQIWMRRFTGNGPEPHSLDEILHDSFSGLQTARRAEDARIIGWIASLNETTIVRRISYTTMAGEAKQNDLIVLLGHLFNHQTHHRGQVHCLLTGFGKQVPPLDLVYYQREE